MAYQPSKQGVIYFSLTTNQHQRISQPETKSPNGWSKVSDIVALQLTP
jgi:hypothetical protein